MLLNYSCLLLNSPATRELDILDATRPAVIWDVLTTTYLHAGRRGLGSRDLLFESGEHVRGHAAVLGVGVRGH